MNQYYTNFFVRLANHGFFFFLVCRISVVYVCPEMEEGENCCPGQSVLLSRASGRGLRLLIYKLMPCLPRDLPHGANELKGPNAVPEVGGNSTTVASWPRAPARPSSMLPATAGHSLRICFLISLDGSSQFCKRRRVLYREDREEDPGRSMGEKHPVMAPLTALAGNTLPWLSFLGSFPWD